MFVCVFFVAVFLVDVVGVVYVVLLETHCYIECCGWCFPLVGILSVVSCMSVVYCRGI